MPFKFDDRAPLHFSRFLSAILLVLSVVLMTVYSMENKQSGFLHNIQNNFRSIVVPLEASSSFIGKGSESLSNTIENASSTPEQLLALKSENEKLNRELSELEEIKIENGRLQKLLALKDEYQLDVVSCRVIGRSFDSWNQTITLDVGSDDGVISGLTVVGTNGVIGQVSSSSRSSCVVRLLTDPQSGVAAIVQSSRAEGIVRGSLNGLLYFDNVANDLEVSVGENVITSGLGGSFQKGLYIGKVVRVEGSVATDSRKIILSQNENISALEEVMVVLSAKDYSPDVQKSGGEQ